jgi:hypothetical protein
MPARAQHEQPGLASHRRPMVEQGGLAQSGRRFEQQKPAATRTNIVNQISEQTELDVALQQCVPGRSMLRRRLR